MLITKQLTVAVVLVSVSVPELATVQQHITDTQFKTATQK